MKYNKKENTIIGVGGNQNDAVTVGAYSIDRIIGLCRVP
jgi:hypothetical protein